MPAEKHSLPRAVEELKRILDAAPTERGNSWIRRMDQALLAIEQAARRHGASLSDDKGCVVDVDSSLNPSPGVARKAEGLHQELNNLLHQIQSLRRMLPNVDPTADDGSRSTAAYDLSLEQVKQVLDGFDRFAAEEAVLIQESVTMDLGAGD
jgi:hypothetical protein